MESSESPALYQGTTLVVPAESLFLEGLQPWILPAAAKAVANRAAFGTSKLVP
jgi:hypothetical protein